MTNFLVTTTADSGAGSLRQAVIDANSDTSGPHTIAFDTAGVFATPQTISLLTALPTITESVTINGTGATNLTIQRDPGAGDFRIFHLEDAALLPISVAISNVTLTGGHEVDGGAILSTGETLALDSVVISGNTASDDGGGIYFSGDNGSTLSITNSTISGNTAADGGGGISALAVTLTDSTVSGNSAGSFGGGMSVGTATLTNSTVSGNASALIGGGIEALTATLTNSTISGNSATLQGGGISATTATLTNSIVLGNNALATDEVSATTANYNGLNIVGVGVDTDTSDGVINAPSVGAVFAATVDIDPGPGTALAGVLADNGGPVQTIALKGDASNPAIDGGDDTLATATDARGLARADFGADASADISDLGAFEAGGLDSLIVTTLGDAVDAFDGLVSLREAIAYANSHPGADTITFDASLADGTITLSADLPALGSDMVIDGGTNDVTVSGDGQFRGFLIGAWEPGTATQIAVTVTIQNLTIADAVAQGGSAPATGAGGGGAGLGGAIFVANLANVSLSGVALVSNQAVGGDGGDGSGIIGGGGGMGGDANVGGGGLGRGATGSVGPSGSGQPGIATGAAPGGDGDAPDVGGAGGGGGAADGGLGAGGGVGGHNALTADVPGDAAGGFGGGGGADGGLGGFGGGGGGGGNFGDGGDGGFAGGGGGSGVADDPGVGGFGGGDGGDPGGGGGGGLGGAIFVQEGGSLTLLGPIFINGGSVAGGIGGGGGGNGSAFGEGMFLEGDGTINFSPGVGQLQLVNDVIADQTGSGGGILDGGSYDLTKAGVGTLILAGTNTYTGATSVNAGLLRVDGSIVSDTTVNSGGMLGGNGTTGAVTVNAGGTLLPGASAGLLTTGDLALVAGAAFEVEFGGTTAGIGGYDQVKVNGTVSLGNASLLGTFLGSFVPTPGDQFTIIDNDGTSDAVSGTFAGLAEGAFFAFGQQDMTITYQGGDGNDVVLTSIAVNDPPAGTDKTVTVVEDGSYVFTVADFGFSDVDDSPASVLAAVVIASLPAAGLLLYNNVAITAAQVAAGYEVSAADITAGLLTFAPAADANGAGYAGFTFQVRDDGGTANGGVDTDQSPNTITVDVTALNDPPAGTDKTVTVVEDGSYVFTVADFGFSDVDDSPASVLAAVVIASLPAAGLLLYNNVAITAAQVAAGYEVSAADITAGLLTFAPAADANGAGYAGFTFQVRDDGGTANGGVDTDQSPNTITVDVTALNDPPAGTDKTVTVVEDGSYVFTVADFGFSDVDDSPASVLAAVVIASLPAAGLLLYNNVAITAAQVAAGYEVSAADITAGLLTFAPAADANGAGYAGFTFQVRDDGGTANGGVDTDQSPNTITVDVTALNDPPAGTDKTVTVVEDGSYVFTVADFGFSDVDDSPASVLAAVVIASLPAAGLLLYNNVAITAAQVAAGYEVSAADITAGLLTFAPAADANGAGYAGFTFQVRDDGGTANGGVDTDQSPNTITVDVTAVDDPTPSGVTIIGTKGADLVDATHTVAGEPLPTAFDDLIKGKKKKDDLSGLAGNDTVKGGKGGDTLSGDTGNDYLKGSKGGDNLIAGDGDDDLKGNKGEDQLNGGAGNDRLDGRVGSDELTGGEGNDTFVFAHPDEKDKVTDFAEGEITALAKSAFKGLGPLGPLDADRFHLGAEAETSKQKVLYDADSGWLLYAKHGSDTADPVRFAKIGKNLDHFDNGDIMVI